MNLEVKGIFGLIALIITVYVIVKIVGSSASTGHKVLWIVLVLVLPLLGVILWWFLGPKS